MVGKISDPNQTSYVLVDRYRLPYLGWVALLFPALAVIFGRMRGLISVVDDYWDKTKSIVSK